MGTILNPATGKPFVTAKSWPQVERLRERIARTLRNKYDAAQTTSQNELHWANADSLGPNAVNSVAVRNKLRSRSRYESANNGYLQGALLTLANDFIGSGPTLQLTDPRFTVEQAAIVERQYARRTKSLKWRQTLRRMRFAKAMDGESFALAYSRKNVVGPSYHICEADQVTDYDQYSPSSAKVDGIRMDALSGEPAFYHFLEGHPGENMITYAGAKGKWFPAAQVLHWYRKDRPWLRGIPETTSTLPLWALLRRYTLAVVQNAEIAADFTVLLESQQNPTNTAFPLGGDGEPTNSAADWFNSFPVDRGLMTVLPDAYSMKQLDPKQPVTMYDAFVSALVQEAVRPLLMPRNVALGNSGGYNMASGALDRQTYRSAITEERMDCNDELLDKDLEAWWYEAIRAAYYFDDDPLDGVRQVVERFGALRERAPDHVFRWDEVPEHTDPVKVATALNILHSGGHLSDTDIQEGRFNRPVEDHYRNLERQNAWRDANGWGLSPEADLSLYDDSDPDDAQQT